MTSNELFFVTSRIVGRAGGYWVEVYVDGRRAPERDMGPFSSVVAAEKAQRDFRNMLDAMGMQRREEG